MSAPGRQACLRYTDAVRDLVCESTGVTALNALRKRAKGLCVDSRPDRKFREQFVLVRCRKSQNVLLL